ncbi:MAG TPA: carbon-nitrogen hydrolase family protein [Candidatus Lokiarchaeia archaeon]|nr:carbon-nitrogen hydrolase family protein [Candidatus Lokiarchaeia archaeon]
MSNTIEVTIGMCQSLVEFGNIEGNLKRGEALARKAASAGCNIIVLPECMDIGWTCPGAKDLAEPIPGKISEQFCDWARELGIYLATGLTERAGDAFYNAAILVSPDGDILLKHRKINELNIAHDIYSPGDSLGVAVTQYGKISIDICADNFPSSQAIGHVLGRMGARLILSPSAWAVPADHDNKKHPYGKMWKQSYAKLAKLYDLHVIGVSNVGWITGGPWKGQKCIGNSIAVGPSGKVIAQGPHGVDAEAMVPVNVTITPQDAWGTVLVNRIRKKGYHGG